MDQFDLRMLFIGITLVSAVLVWIVFDKRKSDNLKQSLEDKKKELSAIISDAEQMIEELNHFSEYIVNQMDLKNAELATTLKKIDEKVERINNAPPEKSYVTKSNRPAVVGAIPEKVSTQADKLTSLDTEPALNSMRTVKTTENASLPKNQHTKMKDKVIPINSRQKEVLLLRDRGMNATDIARNLNIGKGEIQLILELNKNFVEMGG